MGWKQKHEQRITRFWSRLVRHRPCTELYFRKNLGLFLLFIQNFIDYCFDFLLFWRTCIHLQMQRIKWFNINDSTLTLSFSWTLIFIVNKTFYYLVSSNFFFLANCNFSSYMMSSCTAIVLLLVFIFQFNLFSISF